MHLCPQTMLGPSSLAFAIVCYASTFADCVFGPQGYFFPALRALLTLQDRPLLGLIHDSAKSLHFAVQDPPVSAFLFLAIAHCANLICKFQQVRLLPGRPSWFWIEARVVRKLSTW